MKIDCEKCQIFLQEEVKRSKKLLTPARIRHLQLYHHLIHKIQEENAKNPRKIKKSQKKKKILSVEGKRDKLAVFISCPYCSEVHRHILNGKMFSKFGHLENSKCKNEFRQYKIKVK